MTRLQGLAKYSGDQYKISSSSYLLLEKGEDVVYIGGIPFVDDNWPDWRKGLQDLFFSKVFLANR